MKAVELNLIGDSAEVVENGPHGCWGRHPSTSWRIFSPKSSVGCCWNRHQSLDTFSQPNSTALHVFLRGVTTRNQQARASNFQCMQHNVGTVGKGAVTPRERCDVRILWPKVSNSSLAVAQGFLCGGNLSTAASMSVWNIFDEESSNGVPFNNRHT
jgi:hypothetical protein